MKGTEGLNLNNSHVTRPLGSSVSRPSSRRKVARWLLLALGLLMGWVLLTTGRVGTDLWRDSRFGSHRADRWFPWTYPLLSRWAGEHQEFALAALERQWYPYSHEALRDRLAAGWQPPAGWLTLTRWLELGLVDEAVLLGLVAELGQRPVEEARLVLEPLARFIDEGPLARQARVVAWQLIRIAQERGDVEWLTCVPWRNLDTATGREIDRVRVQLMLKADFPSEPGGIRVRMAEIEAGTEFPDPLAGLGENAGRLLHLIHERYDERPFALALRAAFRAHWQKDSLGMEAACLLLRHEDRTSALVLEPLVNGNLRDLTRLHLHPLFLEDLVVGMPHSRLAQGCRDYSAIRGESYFRDWVEPRFDYGIKLLLPAIANARREESAWRRWLTRYPDHPGADDARWWLVRTLEWQGRRYEALQLVFRQVACPIGDSAWHTKRGLEADERIAMCFEERFRWLLDVGTTRDELARFLAWRPENVQVRYALAVRYARVHNYREALRLTEELNLDAPVNDWLLQDQPQLATLGLKDQRNRWRQLARHDLTTRWGRQAVVQSWLKSDGWRNGYLLLYQGNRIWRISYSWYPSEANPTGRPDEAIIRQNYRDANPNFVALQLDPESTEALAKQWTLFPLEESSYATGHGEAWFLERAEAIAEKLTRAKDPRGAAAWWHCYNIKNRTYHLEQVSKHYANDADWARQLLPSPEDGYLDWWNRWF